MELYKTKLNDKVLEYGALIENSNFTEEEWLAINREIVRQNEPEVYEKRKNDNEFINTLGGLISLQERYEELLERLPQDTFSKAGTHPKWVADEVEENTLNKEDVKSDVEDMVESAEDFEALKEQLKEYFEID